jgi:hypothetical protein
MFRLNFLPSNFKEVEYVKTDASLRATSSTASSTAASSMTTTSRSEVRRADPASLGSLLAGVKQRQVTNDDNNANDKLSTVAISTW